MTNSDMLEIALIKKKVTKKELASALGISLQALYNKIGNSAEFKASEIVKAVELLGLTKGERERIFFARNVEYHSTKRKEIKAK